MEYLKFHDLFYFRVRGEKEMKKLKDLLSPYRGLPKEVYVIFFARIINAMGCFVMPLLTLILTNKIGLSSGDAGEMISLAGLCFVLPSLIGGKLADTIGRKRVIIVFDTLAAGFYIACGFMEPSINMVYMIMAAGASMSTAGPAHDSLIADLTTPENRSSAYALSYMGWNIGFAVGPLIGGMLYENHLPIVFIGDAATALISLCLIMTFIKETIGSTKADVSDESRVLEKRETGSIISVLRKRPVLIYFALILFGYNFAYAQWSFMMPIHATQNFGEAFSGKYFGGMASYNGLIVMLFTPLITKLTAHIKNIRCVVYGGIIYAVGFGMLGFLNTLPFFFLSVFIFTIGEIVLSINTTPFIINHTPASHRGRMSAVLPMIMGAGHMVGPMVMGRTIMVTGIETGWIIVGGFVGACALLMILLEKYDDKRKADAKADKTQAA